MSRFATEGNNEQFCGCLVPSRCEGDFVPFRERKKGMGNAMTFYRCDDGSVFFCIDSKCES